MRKIIVIKIITIYVILKLLRLKLLIGFYYMTCTSLVAKINDKGNMGIYYF